jgi:antirestriction protein
MEQATIDRLTEIAEENNLEVDAFLGFCDNQHISEDDAEDFVDDFRDAYVGEFPSEEAFAEWFAEDDGLDIPSLVRPHIDWSDVFHCELRHDYYEVNGGHYFRNI